MQLLAEGKSTKEVATVLDLSVKTAETHRSNIMRKLGLHCLSELVLRGSQPHCPDCGAGLGIPVAVGEQTGIVSSIGTQCHSAA